MMQRWIFVSAAVAIHVRPLSSLSQRLPLSLSQTSNGSPPKPVRKKKVAIILGYDGRPFHGNQFIADSKCPAVENVLFEALWRAGAMKPETYNQQVPSKISLTRSSRTDKGVHAARIVFGAKVMLDFSGEAAADKPEADGPPSVDGLKYRLNRHLPETVRCWGVVPIRGGFDARRTCHWREYVYVIPLEAMLTNEESADEALSRMDACLKLFEGTHCFHHYTPWKNFGIKDARQRVLAVKGNRNRFADDLELENFFQSDQTSIKPEYAELREWAKGLDRYFNERPILHDFVSTIYKCEREGGIFYASVGGQSVPAVSIRICGQRFIYNQIRMMMGAAMTVVAGYYPLEAIQNSLMTENALAMPLAPAEGLFLHSAGFELNDPPMYLNRETQKLYHDTFGPVRDEVVFIDQEDWQKSVDFEDILRQATVEEWYAPYFLRETTARYLFSEREEENIQSTVPDSENKIETKLVQVWQGTLDKYRDALNEHVVNTLTTQDTDLRRDRELRSVQMQERLVDRRREHKAILQENDKSWEQFQSAVRSLRFGDVETSEVGWPEEPELIPLEKILDYKSVTPRRTNSLLAQHFRVPPGKYCQDAQLAMALRLTSGKIDEEADLEQLLKIVEKEGLIAMALEGVKMEAEARREFSRRKTLLKEFREMREKRTLRS